MREQQLIRNSRSLAPTKAAAAILRREHLAERIAPLRLGVELDRFRTAARSLVSVPSAQARIRMIAAALLRCGSLDAEQIYELAR
jgi:hypothetical protein